MDCLFCKIVDGDIPARVVFEDNDTLAFHDIDPQAPVHILVIPRRHVSGLPDAVEELELLGRVMQTATRVAQQQGVSPTGFRCVVNSGHDAQQSVQHLHMHVLGGRGLSWPPG
ncbi:MAG: histidine triad nucleotide-binding protein [Chloroflexota bacterium]